MKQYFCHYEKWEDYKAGMYRITHENDRDLLVINAIALLKNSTEFYQTMKAMIESWVIAAKVNLTNNQQNKRAWLGAAACCFRHNTPEYLTRIAWNLLNKEVQDSANQTAERIISEYSTKTYDAQTLFSN